MAKAKDEPEITYAAIECTLRGLKRAGLNATIPLLASEMGVKVSKLGYFIEQNEHRFRFSTEYTDDRGRFKSEGIEVMTGVITDQEFADLTKHWIVIDYQVTGGGYPLYIVECDINTAVKITRIADVLDRFYVEESQFLDIESREELLKIREMGYQLIIPRFKIDDRKQMGSLSQIPDAAFEP